MSESVHKNVSNKKGIETKFMREEFLKNVKEPMKIYEVNIESVAFEQLVISLTKKEPSKQQKQLEKKYHCD